jgi:STE24 endopeptidase
MGSIQFLSGPTNLLKEISFESWTMPSLPGVVSGRVAMRDGEKLRTALLDFAEAHGINIDQVYMIDGSSKDVRANAFAAGAGKSRIIGLYDTLFLGEPPTGADNVEFATDPTKLFSIRHLGNKLRGVSTDEVSRRTLRRSKPTKAMTDDEILAVMGHELGHSALHHVEHGMVTEALTSFWTFALLGWMVHSPVLAASLGLAAPVTHIAVVVYHRVFGKALDSVTDLLNDWITRTQEYAADAYSAQVSDQFAMSLQTALTKLALNSNADPDEPWFYEYLHDDHPTIAKRCARVEHIRQKKFANKGANKDAAAGEALLEKEFIMNKAGSEVKKAAKRKDMGLR